MSDEIIINIQEDIENIVVSPQEDIENIVVSLATLPVITVNGQVGNVIIDLSKYESVYSTFNANSATYTTLNYVNNKFFPISGGIVNGNINVLSKILSANRDLFDIFLTSETDSQSISYNPSSYELSITSGNTISLSSINSTFFVNSGKYEDVYSTVTTVSGNWDTSYNTLSTLTYENVGTLTYETIQEYTSSNPPVINKGSTVELYNGRVYIFAGTDVTNPSHYLEVNANPITAIYKEISLFNSTSAIIDTYYVDDFKCAKYSLQIETSFNNEIYYSEINVIAAVGLQKAVLVEYGQVYTTELITKYDANFNINRIELIVFFPSHIIDSNNRLVLKGHRTNYFKI